MAGPHTRYLIQKCLQLGPLLTELRCVEAMQVGEVTVL